MSILDAAALERIELERRFPPELVDQHFVHGQLARVAGFYAAHAGGNVDLEKMPDEIRGWIWTPVGWPLNPSFWAPRRDPQKNLARSIAFAAMEADRLERARQPRNRRAS